jgi:hypothetical protein
MRTFFLEEEDSFSRPGRFLYWTGRFLSWDWKISFLGMKGLSPRTRRILCREWKIFPETGRFLTRDWQIPFQGQENFMLQRKSSTLYQK